MPVPMSGRSRSRLDVEVQLAASGEAALRCTGRCESYGPREGLPPLSRATASPPFDGILAGASPTVRWSPSPSSVAYWVELLEDACVTERGLRGERHRGVSCRLSSAGGGYRQTIAPRGSSGRARGRAARHLHPMSQLAGDHLVGFVHRRSPGSGRYSGARPFVPDPTITVTFAPWTPFKGRDASDRVRAGLDGCPS